MSVATGVEPVPGGRGSDQAPTRRTTVLTPDVVAKVAAAATARVPGVYALADGPGRTGALSQVRAALPGGGGDEHQAGVTGVQVEVGEVQAAFDVQLVAEDDVPLFGLAGDVRERVVDRVEELTGYEVTEVNIAVLDVHLDDEELS